ARMNVTPEGRFRFALESVKVRSPGAFTGERSSRNAASERLLGESFPEGPRISTRTLEGASAVNSRSAGSRSKYSGSAREVTSSGSPSTAYHSRMASSTETSFHQKLWVTRCQIMTVRSGFGPLPFRLGNLAVRIAHGSEPGQPFA